VNRISSTSSLFTLGAVSACAYLVIAASGQSLHEDGSGGHSLLVSLSLFALCFACYLAAVGIAMRTTRSRESLWIVIAGAAIFRGLLLFSGPIEEIDLYRYLWDGAASAAGVNPFRYAPQQVLAADIADDLPGDLAKLVALRDRSPVLAEILARVHFGELPTIYPPVGQVVFALATAMSPDAASVRTRMTIMKAWFVLFDVLTMAIVVKLLRRVGRPAAAVVIYAWCPLVIKEIANSGHLDSLAVFLTTLAFYVGAKACFSQARRGWWGGASWAACLLGLAIGAKLYPVVLAPLLLLTVAARRGWRAAATASFFFMAMTVLVLIPMWPSRVAPAWKPPASVEQAAELPPLPPEEMGLAPRDPSQTVRAFLSYWEMNDFLFLLIMENVRPTEPMPARERAWFSLMPEGWRTALAGALVDRLGLDADVAPFLFTRAITALVFLLLAGSFAWRATRCSSAEDFLRHAFLTVAWFWLLLPTGNPWYWTWAMPLLPFGRSRVWLALSGLVMLYYLRFWLVYHYPQPGLLGTPYAGGPFFDYVVTWFEFAPFFIALACSWLCLRRVPALGRSHRIQRKTGRPSIEGP
ncbi:MAG TPA: glycosyltransferase 87 family protein, partial [Pirellulales bacterium]|nr:glycosyltransferase 87 family protein [Pirellulales bacterium]